MRQPNAVDRVTLPTEAADDLATLIAVQDRQFVRVMLCLWILLSVSFFVVAAVTVWNGTPLDTPSRSESKWLILCLAFVLSLAGATMVVILAALPLRLALNVAVKIRRRIKAKESILLAVVIGLCAGYWLICKWEARSLAPPQGVSKLSEFVAVMSPPHELLVMNTSKGEFLLWTGRTAWLTLPSGPSGYIFDQHGVLINWSWHSGDGGPIDDLLRATTNSRKLSLEEALHWVRRNDSPTK